MKKMALLFTALILGTFLLSSCGLVKPKGTCAGVKSGKLNKRK